MAIDPTEAQARALGNTAQDEPAIFLNCHKYYTHARYDESYVGADAPPDVSGKEAYHRYLSAVETDFMPRQAVVFCWWDQWSLC